jgi:hypothetical protein
MYLPQKPNHLHAPPIKRPDPGSTLQALGWPEQLFSSERVG